MRHPNWPDDQGSPTPTPVCTRLYRNGTCLLRDFPAVNGSEHLPAPDTGPERPGKGNPYLAGLFGEAAAAAARPSPCDRRPDRSNHPDARRCWRPAAGAGEDDRQPQSAALASTVRAWSSYPAATSTSKRLGTVALMEVKSRRPLVRA